MVAEGAHPKKAERNAESAQRGSHTCDASIQVLLDKTASLSMLIQKWLAHEQPRGHAGGQPPDYRPPLLPQIASSRPETPEGDDHDRALRGVSRRLPVLKIFIMRPSRPLALRSTLPAADAGSGPGRAPGADGRYPLHRVHRHAVLHTHIADAEFCVDARSSIRRT